MAPKSKKSAAQSARPNDLQLEPSPYGGSMSAIVFEDTRELIVHTSIVRKFPKLWPSHMGFSSASIEMRGVLLEAGHVIVHFMYTGLYRSLQPQGEVLESSKAAAELKTSIGVYLAAQTYELPALEELAKEVIERQSSELTLERLFEVVQQTYPVPRQGDVWFPALLASQVRKFHEGLTIATADECLHNMGEASTVTKILLKSVIELRLQALKDSEQRAREDIAAALEFDQAVLDDCSPVDDLHRTGTPELTVKANAAAAYCGGDSPRIHPESAQTYPVIEEVLSLDDGQFAHAEPALEPASSPTQQIKDLEEPWPPSKKKGKKGKKEKKEKKNNTVNGADEDAAPTPCEEWRLVENPDFVEPAKERDLVSLFQAEPPLGRFPCKHEVERLVLTGVWGVCEDCHKAVVGSP